MSFDNMWMPALPMKRLLAMYLVNRLHFSKVAITLRGSVSTNDNNWAAMLFDGKDYYFRKNYLIHIVDRVGGGDTSGRVQR